LESHKKLTEEEKMEKEIDFHSHHERKNFSEKKKIKTTNKRG